ncbi:MAG: hypothetical protein HUJ96_08700 [Marinilabiliaceae bacterium]|nr:hypothetical protein [Marinilabiliaceae bacterium]
MQNLKCMLKSEVARIAGVGYTTFGKWLRQVEREHPEGFLSSRSKLLTPGVIRYMAQKFCFEEELEEAIADEKGSSGTL